MLKLASIPTEFVLWSQNTTLLSETTLGILSHYLPGFAPLLLDGCLNLSQVAMVKTFFIKPA
jgi:hypothetical protein